jgi:L-threonylcarbamoyladenylate synthase
VTSRSTASSSVQTGLSGGAAIDRAVAVLRSGGLVAFPTETVYGLGADAENIDAVARVFAVKGRPPTHPLILHIASADVLHEWVAEVPDAARILAARFWPGPLTVVLRRSPRVPLAVTGGLETIAVRVPAHPTALALLGAFRGGLAAPSANRFGSVSPTSALHVKADLGNDVDLVLDGGPCGVGVESTIVDLTGSAPVVLRPGGVSREDLEDALGIPIATIAGATPVRVPGSHPSHYAPRAEVRIADRSGMTREAEAGLAQGRRVGLLLPFGPFGEAAPTLEGLTVLRVPQAATDFARTLYGLLREFDEQGCDLVIVSLPDEAGIGAAIADRLRRAASPRTIAPRREKTAEEPCGEK